MCIAGKIVAHAFYPADARGGNVHFDADETWTVTATEGRHFCRTRWQATHAERNIALPVPSSVCLSVCLSVGLFNAGIVSKHPV